MSEYDCSSFAELEFYDDDDFGGDGEGDAVSELERERDRKTEREGGREREGEVEGGREREREQVRKREGHKNLPIEHVLLPPPPPLLLYSPSSSYPAPPSSSAVSTPLQEKERETERESFFDISFELQTAAPS